MGSIDTSCYIVQCVVTCEYACSAGSSMICKLVITNWYNVW